MRETRLFLNGDEAVAWGVRLCRPHVISAYPITPQTIVVEKLAEFIANGELKSEYCYVESEHSAMATAMGASLAGARAFTATSSQGLVYMCEMLHYVSGSRFPIVMMNANRTLAAPWNIFGDQRDSLSQRDSGWVQVYVENGQEALDMILQAYRIAEHPDVYLPVMVNLDGFINTHTYEMVSIPDQAEVDQYLPPFHSINAIDFDKPRSFCMSASTDWNTEFRLQQQEATLAAGEAALQADEDFQKHFGRRWGGLTDEYRMEDAEICLCALGSACGTIRGAVDKLRAEGVRAGMVKIRFLRPFPLAYFANLPKSVQALGVVDRDLSFGLEGAVATEVRAALARAGNGVKVINFIAGIAGRDIPPESICKMYGSLQKAADGKDVADVEYMDVRW